MLSAGLHQQQVLTSGVGLLQTTSVVIDNINIHVLPADQQPTHSDVPPSREAVCPMRLLTFDELTQLGDL